MDAIVIRGGKRLKGKVQVSGAKNAALPIMMACVLIRDMVHLGNVPRLRDIETTRRLLDHLGCRVGKLWATQISINASRAKHADVPYDLVKTMRASVLLLGPLLARYGHAKVSLPGGCAIGARPINYHLQALELMGAKIQLEEGYVYADAKRLHGAEIRFPECTVTGTENILMAAVLAEGKTVLHNAAKEPEVVDLADFLVKAGARIEGAGTDTMTVHGVEELSGCRHEIMPDRIEAGTFLVAAALTHGDVLVEGVSLEIVQALVDKLRESGVEVVQEKGGIRVRGVKRARSVDVTTHPFPGFPTDMQAQFMVLMAAAKGKCVISETIFENRFMHVAELMRMGAKIRIEDNHAFIEGVPRLGGARLMATDLRASASLVLAGLCARGETRVSRVYHLDRGYERIERKLRRLGARIRRVTE